MIHVPVAQFRALPEWAMARSHGLRPVNGSPQWGSNKSAQGNALVVLHKSLAIDLRRAYDLRHVCVRGSPLLLVCDHFSPQRGSDMSTQSNALGPGTT